MVAGNATRDLSTDELPICSQVPRSTRICFKRSRKEHARVKVLLVLAKPVSLILVSGLLASRSQSIEAPFMAKYSYNALGTRTEN